MSYRWTPEGPAFDFPSPYLTQNRLLVLRAWLLAGCAVLVLVAARLLAPTEVDQPAVRLEETPEPASIVPHIVTGLMLFVLAGMDWLLAHRRRSLVLVPGQPASLMPEVRREGSGQSPGVPGLLHVMGRGTAAAPPLGGPYAAWLARLGPNLPAAPATLHAYLRLRFSHLLLGGLLLLVLGASAAVGYATGRLPGLALAAAGIALVSMGVALRHLFSPIKPALSPLVVSLWVVVAALVAAAALALSDRLPGAQALPRLGLPGGVAVMLVGGLLFEWLGVRAARADLKPPRAVAIPGVEARLPAGSEPESLMREVDMELHRRWTEGIPNRRYAWVPPQMPRGGGGEFMGLVLEESQPMSPADGSGLPAAASQHGALWWLSALAVCAGLLGGLMWVALAVLQMRGSMSWLAGSCGLACLAVGVHGMRLAHVLWSRIELDSTLTWLEFRGRAAPPPAQEPAGEPQPWRAEELRVQARVVRARSALYAAAPHRSGSRVLVSVSDDPAASTQWTVQLADIARSLQARPPVPPRPVARPAARPAEPPRPGPSSRPAGGRSSARFCPTCGTAVLNGARFCQHCGTVLPVD